LINHLENHEHAFVKNNTVISILVFDGHDSNLLEDCRKHFEADEVICCCDHGKAYLDGTWNGTQFIPLSPYPSWVWNENQWVAPIPMPEDGLYKWNESEQNWNMIVLSSE
jgi:hypothetical protein